ncbi:lytic transglycosylase domain-containing protein [Brevundimonas sp.]|uniref:lytic transglycosylase domain-containing protein n=2 Tax=unclassified Brevundimonas TaxID=2622653 RepID=UPI0028A0E5E2|nr:lytic transglycosylase domain-containing protein [Brevundimonas sp.]
MIATTLAAALAVMAPPTQDVINSVPAAYNSQVAGSISPSDQSLVQQGLAAARARDVVRTQQIMASISDPAARKLVEWALVDTSDRQLSYAELLRAENDLKGWPRAESRRAAAERALNASGMGGDAVLAFFAEQPPRTVQGAISLASALEQAGRRDEAQTLIRNWWREESFDAAEQDRILSRWSAWLTTDDHSARLSTLLSGPHGPATRAMVNLVPAERQAIANAVMNLRTAYAPDTLVASLSPQQATDPNVVLERVRLLRSANRQSEAFDLLRYLPPAPKHTEGQNTLWSERRNLFLDALRMGNNQAAYDAFAGHGFSSGERSVDAEFFAGWAALVKLNDPRRAAQHFETLRNISQTPITQGRALYWLGRAAEAQGDRARAQEFYAAGGQHWQTFYGQLAAEKAGVQTLNLPGEPDPSPEDIQRFESYEMVRATRILGQMGEKTLMRVFAYHLDDNLPLPYDLSMLFDLVKSYGDQFGAMMVGRAASGRGFIMPERMYPIQLPEQVPGMAPTDFALAITRQESSFDPSVQSHANARGMMQLLPTTAAGVARRMGLSYSDDRLWDANYNMTLGSYHLGELLNNFGQSPLLAAVGYNAGPARPPQWTARCGDPRQAQVDPLDFIECAPITETRNYMMRVMENMQIYRARLNGGSAPLTPTADLARGTPPYAGPRPYSE